MAGRSPDDGRDGHDGSIPDEFSDLSIPIEDDEQRCAWDPDPEDGAAEQGQLWPSAWVVRKTAGPRRERQPRSDRGLPAGRGLCGPDLGALGSTRRGPRSLWPPLRNRASGPRRQAYFWNCIIYRSCPCSCR